MSASNQDQVSIATTSYISATAALNTLYELFHATYKSGIRKCFLIADGLQGSGLSGTVSVKLVALDQAGGVSDINAQLNVLTAGVVPLTYNVTGTTCPLNGAVLDPNLSLYGNPVPYSGGDVIFSLDRTTDFIVPKGSTVCALISTAASSLSASSLKVGVAYYEL